MQNLAVARKYAKALFAASRKQGNTDRVDSDMDSILGLLEKDPGFLQFLLSPQVATEEKHAFVKNVFTPRVDPMVNGFLRLLVDKGRIGVLPDIAEEYRVLSEEARGIVRVRVETFSSLAPDQRDRLAAELGVLTGQQVILETRVNPEILGGIIVTYRDKILDRSVRRGLKNLSETLKTGV